MPLISTGRSWKKNCMTSTMNNHSYCCCHQALFLELQVVRLNCFDLLLFSPVSLFTPTSPFEHEHTMKRRLEDQEIVYAPQQQQPRRPQIQGITDNLQLSLPTPAVVEAAADNMQPSTGIQYSLPQGYQVWKLLVVPGHWNTWVLI